MIAARLDEAAMDNDQIAAHARAIGLHKALADFPEDVFAAAREALGHTSAIEVPHDPADEPWPPMRAGLDL
jgi:thiamine pyrophosphate-dependent acetolactate synthase large subunit-like protein